MSATAWPVTASIRRTPAAIELSEIIPGKNLAKPVCSRKEGDAPEQTVNFDEMMEKTMGNSMMNEDFGEDLYGDKDFNDDDLDLEGFDISDGDPYSDSNY